MSFFANVIHIEMKFKITGTALFYFITPNIILLGNDGPEFIMKFHTTSIVELKKRENSAIQKFVKSLKKFSVFDFNPYIALFSDFTLIY